MSKVRGTFCLARSTLGKIFRTEKWRLRLSPKCKKLLKENIIWVMMTFSFYWQSLNWSE